MPMILASHLRQFRAVLAVCKTGSTAQAATVLPLSQSAIARAIRELETAIGVPVFDRTARGMVPTPVGQLLAHRAERALNQLAVGEREAVLAAEGGAGRTAVGRFAGSAGFRHLQTFIVFCETRSETLAAARLGVSQPAVNQTLRQLEHMAGVRLFYRSARGVRLTESGEAVLRRSKLALDELRQAAEDLAATQGKVRGRLVIGSLPLSSGALVPRAVDRVLARHKDIQIAIVDGTYDGLMYQLRHADIDVLVGALRPHAPGADIIQTPLFEDTLSVVVRKGHPLEGKSLTGLQDLVSESWIAPLAASPAREAYERAFRAAGVEPPATALEVNSAIMLQALLQVSDRLALLSRRQMHFGIASGAFSVLPVPVMDTARFIGLTMRADADPNSTMTSFIHELGRLAAELI